MIEDMCKFIADIEKDPFAIVPPFTVRDWMLLRLHIPTCEKCSASIDRVNAKYKDYDTGIDISLN